MKLALYTGSWVQKQCPLSDLNLMLVFQVNCPGCLAYALPQLEALALLYPTLNVFALSTAFENFELNNFDSTLRLVERGELSPAPSRYYAQLGQKVLPYKISVPVVMDRFLPDEKLRSLPKEIIQLVDDGMLSDKVIQTLRNQLNQRFIPTLSCGRTFVENEMQGTPSWFLFGEQFEIIDQWFGRKDIDWVKASIEGALLK